MTRKLDTEVIQTFRDVGYQPTTHDLELLADQYWRLNNLYKIIDDDGKVFQFKMKPVQEQLYWNLWYRNVVLKARQHGFTTLLVLFALDSALFNENFSCGIIAHKLTAAQSIFRKKVDYAYRTLPGWVKNKIGVEKKTSEEMVFDNGSTISVSTSYRSGTLQFLHVSEMGAIAAKSPEKSTEIRTGAFEAVPTTGIIVVESTAEGAHGDFKELTDKARAAEEKQQALTRLSWKLHFVPWYRDPKYKLTAEETKAVPIAKRLKDYFEDLAKKWGIKLTPRQKAWYVLKEQDLGELMWREYPSTPDEPFKVSLSGAYWATQMRTARVEGRITKVPHTDGVGVETWWDIGRDTTSIWFTQDIGLQVHVISYFQYANRGLKQGVEHVLSEAQEKGYRYEMHHFPHDMGVRDYSNENDETRLEVAQKMGLFHAEALPRMSDKDKGIEAGRNFIQHCIFDEEECEEGIAGLDAYRKEWDAKHGVWSDKPLHDWASHPADGFQQLALYHEFNIVKTGHAPVARPVVTTRKFG